MKVTSVEIDMYDALVDPLLNKYRQCALDHRRYSTSDSKLANTAYDELMKIFRQLVSEGRDRLILDLCSDPDPAVRSWAAAQSLELDEEKAVAALRQLEEARVPLLSLSAHYTLKEWRAGNLHFRTDQETQRKRQERQDSVLAERLSDLPDKASLLSIPFMPCDHRVASVNRLYPGLVQKKEGLAAPDLFFRPKSIPPSIEETLAWLWVVATQHEPALLRRSGPALRAEILREQERRARS